MLAGIPNPNDTPKRSDIAKISKALAELTSIKISEEIIPNIIQNSRKAVLLRTLSLSLAPTIAENMAPTKWMLHIIKAVSFMSPFKILKAKEYHVKALDINTIFATADLAVIPNLLKNFPSSI
jgi:hypothetical protein